MKIDEAFLPSVTSLIDKTLSNIHKKLVGSPRDIADVLRRRFDQWLAAAHLPATGDNVARFLVSLGMKAAVAHSLLPVAAPRQKESPYKFYQDTTAAKIARELRSDIPDTKYVLRLVRELVAHARDVGGDDKDRVIQILKSIKHHPAFQNNLRSMKLLPESEQDRIIGLTRFLLETAAVTADAIHSGVRRFYPAGERILTARELEDVLVKAAIEIKNNPASLARPMSRQITKPKSLISRFMG